MAKKISELTTISSLDSSDVLPIVDVSANTTNKIPLSDLANAIEEIVSPTLLYENANGSNDEIALSDSLTNYSSLEIFYKNNNDQYSSVKVYEPNGKLVSLLTCQPSTTSYIKSTILSISATTITPISYSQLVIYNNAYSGVTSDTNYHYIIKVIGYK